MKVDSLKETIDWEKREEELIMLLDKYRSKDGSYDCVICTRGDKDDCYAAWMLTFKYHMHPLTVTWAPSLYADMGLKNFQSFSRLFDNYLFTPNGKVHKLLTKISFEKSLEPEKPFIMGQKSLGPKISVLFNIPIVFDYQKKIQYENVASGDQMQFTIGSLSINQLISDYGLNKSDLETYRPVDAELLKEKGTKVYDLGCFIHWTPEEAYDLAVEKCGYHVDHELADFYSKHDCYYDKMETLYDYIRHIKTGMYARTYDNSKEISNGGEGKFSEKYIKEILEYLDMSEEGFWQYINKAKSIYL